MERDSSSLWQVAGLAAFFGVAAGVGYLLQQNAPVPEKSTNQPKKREQAPPLQYGFLDKNGQGAGGPNLGPPETHSASSDDEPSEGYTDSGEEDPDLSEENFLAFQSHAEGRLKQYPQETQEWCDIAIAIAHQYLRHGRAARASYLLQQAFAGMVARKHHGLEPYLQVLGGLQKLHSGAQHKQSLHRLTPYFTYVGALVAQTFQTTPPNDPSLQVPFAFVCKAIKFAHQAASWTFADVMYPLVQYFTRFEDEKLLLEEYVTCLHQQGRTKYGLELLELYIAKLETLNPVICSIQLEWATMRAAKLYFYLDDFENSKKKLTSKPLENSLQAQLDLFSTLSELQHFDELEVLEAQLRKLERQQILALQPLAQGELVCRSRYLLSMTITILSTIQIDFRVCRVLPSRKEAEPESEETAKRKLEKFFCVAEFEGADSIVEQDVETYNFTLQSPPFKTPLKKEGWTKLTVSLYSDRTKSHLYGVHRQLISNVTN